MVGTYSGVSLGLRAFNKIPPWGAPSVNAGLTGKSKDAVFPGLPFPELEIENEDLDADTGEAGR